MRTICVLCVTATALSAIFVQQAAAQTEEMIARGAYLVNGPGACGIATLSAVRTCCR